MSIRNKRIARERERLKEAYVLGPESSTSNELMVICVPELGVDLRFKQSYPFTFPEVIVNGKPAKTKFLRQYKLLEPFLSACGVSPLIPCVCCSPLECAWVPSYGIREVLDEYVTVSTRLNQLSGYAAIHDAMPFDNGVHGNILQFLL